MASLDPSILADIARRRLGFENQANAKRQSINEGYNTGSTDLTRQNDEQVRGLDSGYANRGTFLSGLRVDSQGRLARNTADRFADLARTRQQGLQGVDLGLQQQLNELQGYQSQQEQAATQQAAAQELARQQAAQQLDYQNQQLGATQQQAQQIADIQAAQAQQQQQSDADAAAFLAAMQQAAQNKLQSPDQLLNLRRTGAF